MYPVAIIQPVEGLRFRPLDDQKLVLQTDSPYDFTSDKKRNGVLLVSLQVHKNKPTTLLARVYQKTIFVRPEGLVERKIDALRQVAGMALPWLYLEPLSRPKVEILT